MLVVFLYYLCPTFETRSLNEPATHSLGKNNWLARPRGPPTFSMTLWLQVFTTMPGFLHGFLESQLGSSFLYGKHFTD